jgi:hypothetical protein
MSGYGRNIRVYIISYLPSLRISASPLQFLNVSNGLRPKQESCELQAWGSHPPQLRLPGCLNRVCKLRGAGATFQDDSRRSVHRIYFGKLRVFATLRLGE